VSFSHLLTHQPVEPELSQMAADISSSLTVGEGHIRAMVPPGKAPTGPSSLRPVPKAAVKRIAPSGLPSRRTDRCELEPLTFVRH